MGVGGGEQTRDNEEEGGRGGDGQSGDFKREEGETGLTNPCISIPRSLYGGRRGGGRDGRKEGRREGWRVQGELEE